MTATVAPATYVTETSESTESPKLWKAGLRSGLVAAVATSVVAGAASAAGVSLEIGPEQEAIPAVGFGQVTLMCVAAGLLVATAIRRWARSPRRTFTRVAVALTLVSFVPDLTLQDTDPSTIALLMVTHVVAAALVIPAVANALPERNAR